MTLRPVEKLYPFKGHRIETAPAVEPVTAAELRTHLGETTAGLSDTEAEALITAARSMLEEQTGLALITQTWTLVYDNWPNGRADWWDGVRQGYIGDIAGASADIALMLPRYPLQSIDGVNTYAADGTSTAIDVAATFDTDTYQKPGRMALKFGATWPTSVRPTNGVEISYIAGYGDTASDVPEAIKLAIKMLASNLYTHKGDECATSDPMKASGALALVGQFKAARL